MNMHCSRLLEPTLAANRLYPGPALDKGKRELILVSVLDK